MIYLVLLTKAILELLIILLGYLVIALIGIFIANKITVHYKYWKWERNYDYHLREQEERRQQQHKRRIEQELHRKEQAKYPLFFWRETCKKELDNGNL